MIKKVLFFFLALITVGVAILSYSKFYARKDVTQMMNDARLNASIKTALALNRHMKGTEIDVSVDEGTVILSGSVGTQIQKQLAGEVALSIKGAKTVQNALHIKKILSRKTDENERTLGEKLDDLTIEASVKTALMLNENIHASRINVRCFLGAVTLDGSVSSVAESELAAKIAEDVEGVASVQKTLRLNGEEADDEAAVEEVDDVRIVAQVRDALMVNRNIDSTEIEISSSGGIVTLSGLVHTGAEKDLVQKITEECRGVKGVVNDMRVRQAQRG